MFPSDTRHLQPSVSTGYSSKAVGQSDRSEARLGRAAAQFSAGALYQWIQCHGLLTVRISKSHQR